MNTMNTVMKNQMIMQMINTMVATWYSITIEIMEKKKMNMGMRKRVVMKIKMKADRKNPSRKNMSKKNVSWKKMSKKNVNRKKMNKSTSSP